MQIWLPKYNVCIFSIQYHFSSWFASNCREIDYWLKKSFEMMLEDAFHKGSVYFTLQTTRNSILHGEEK